jgi:hypothetical protein
MVSQGGGMTQNAEYVDTPLGNVVARSTYDDDGNVTDVEIVQADPLVEISLTLLAAMDNRFGTVTVRLGSINPVEYVVVAPTANGVKAKRVSHIDSSGTP